MSVRVSLIPENTQKFALQLQSDFVGATRPARHPEWIDLIKSIQTDHSFDAGKIAALLRQSNPTINFPSLVDCEKVGEKYVLELAAECKLLQPLLADHYIFRQLEAAQTLPPLDLYRFKNVLFSYDLNPLQYYLFDEEGRLLDRLICGATPFRDPPILKITEPLVFADDIFPAFNICHLLFDKFPRIHHVHKRVGVRHALLANGGNYVEQLLMPWGMKMSALKTFGMRGSLLLSEAWFFSNSYGRIPHPGRFGSPTYSAAFQSLREHLRIGESRAERKLFLRRPDKGSRSITNIGSVQPILERYSIELVDPGQLSFQQQVRLFAEAKLIVGVHGAGLANMLLMPPGGTLLELLPPLYATASYWGLASSLEITYRHIVCDDSELGPVDARHRCHAPQHILRSVEIPLEKLDNQLHELLC